jgi:hypothetical protein
MDGSMTLRIVGAVCIACGATYPNKGEMDVDYAAFMHVVMGVPTTL